ncbi:MAG: phage uncharacterized protein [Caulobacter sp.]|nr:phage uncharacterized protein [Caulobacter sp.]
MSEPSRTHRQIIVEAGGATLVARALGYARGRVAQWQWNGVPARYWGEMAAKGIADAEELARTAPVDGRRKVFAPKAIPAGETAAISAVSGPAATPPVSRRAKAARRDLPSFCRFIDVPGVGERVKLAAHHKLWLAKLAAVERGEIRRLMGFMPPGSAKSTYAVDVFTPWFLARAANRSVLVVTYATTLAGRRGRKARGVTRQPAFGEAMGVRPDRTRASALDWSLDNGSDWMGAGMLAGITGNRADLIVIDDPVKGRAEADSPLIRRRTREEFDDTVRTRLKAGGRIVLIQTRWHEDDLAGSLLPEGYDGASGPVLCRDGEVWEVVNIPAQAERTDDPLGRTAGDYLWPEYWGADHWGQFKLNPRTWNALYQQRPKPDEGSYFQRSCFRRFCEGQQPAALRYYGSSDYAVSEGRGDYTRLNVWGVDAAMNLWRVASWGGRTSSEQWIQQQCDLVAEFRPLGGIRKWFGEAGVIQRAVEPMLKAALRERRLVCGLEWLASSQDKSARARSAQSLVREGRVWVRDDADGDCFIEECVAFPAGRHDDEVDCLSLIGRVVDRLSRPVVGRVEEFADGGRVFED